MSKIKDLILGKRVSSVCIPSGLPCDCTCVYVLYRDDDIVYVGQSTNLKNRWYSHKTDKDFDSMYYFSVESEMMLDVESYLIGSLSPEYNKNIGANQFLINETKLKQILIDVIKDNIDESDVIKTSGNGESRYYFAWDLHDSILKSTDLIASVFSKKSKKEIESYILTYLGD